MECERWIGFYQLLVTHHQCGKKQFLTYYFIAAHLGCTQNDMEGLKSFVSRELKVTPEQAQILPTPSTVASVMYYTGLDPFTKKEVFVERDVAKKEKQKSVLVAKRHTSYGCRARR